MIKHGCIIFFFFLEISLKIVMAEIILYEQKKEHLMGLKYDTLAIVIF